MHKTVGLTSAWLAGPAHLATGADAVAWIIVPISFSDRASADGRNASRPAQVIDNK